MKATDSKKDMTLKASRGPACKGAKVSAKSKKNHRPQTREGHRRSRKETADSVEDDLSTEDLEEPTIIIDANIFQELPTRYFEECPMIISIEMTATRNNFGMKYDLSKIIPLKHQL